MSSVVKIGPWGSVSQWNERQGCDITVAPLRLKSITLNYGLVVDGLGFSYRDHENVEHIAGPWGGRGGGPKKIVLARSEFVTEVHGEYGDYYGHNCIANLRFVTNKRSYGPYGSFDTSYGDCGISDGDSDTSQWDPFSIPVKNNGSIVGFFVHTGSQYLSAIGVYVRPFL